MKKISKVLKKARALYLAIALVVTLVSIEAGSRAYYSFRMEDASYLLYPYKGKLSINIVGVQTLENDTPVFSYIPPGKINFSVNGDILHSLSINKSGFRGKDFDQAAKARYTLVTLGGSSTFSSECPEGTSYPEVMEGLINEQYGPGTVAVVNRGMNAMPTSRVAELFELEVAPKKPHLVTVCSAFNGTGAPVYIDLRPSHAPWHMRALYEKSLFYTASFNSRLTNEFNRSNRIEITKRNYERDLLSIIRTAKKTGTKLVFIQQPLLPLEMVDPKKLPNSLGGDESSTDDPDMVGNMDMISTQVNTHGELCDIMARIAKSENIPIVDPRNVMLSAPDPKELFWVFLHLTPKGAEVMANEIIVQMNEKYGGLEGLLAGANENSP